MGNTHSRAQQHHHQSGGKGSQNRVSPGKDRQRNPQRSKSTISKNPAARSTTLQSQVNDVASAAHHQTQVYSTSSNRTKKSQHSHTKSTPTAMHDAPQSQSQHRSKKPTHSHSSSLPGGKNLSAFRFHLSLLPSRGPELERTRELQRRQECWRGADKEAARAVDRRQGFGRREDSEREWAEECVKQRSKAAEWESARRTQSREKASQAPSASLRRSLHSSNKPFLRDSTADFPLNPSPEDGQPYWADDAAFRELISHDHYFTMGQQHQEGDGSSGAGSLTALPLFPRGAAMAGVSAPGVGAGGAAGRGGSGKDSRDARMWRKCVKAGLVVDVPPPPPVDSSRHEVGDKQYPLRWKWINGKGRGVNSVDEELGFA